MHVWYVHETFIKVYITKLFVFLGVLDHLKPILKNGETLEKEEALKIVWELSFDKDNRQEIQVSSVFLVLSVWQQYDDTN